MYWKQANYIFGKIYFISKMQFSFKKNNKCGERFVYFIYLYICFYMFVYLYILHVNQERHERIYIQLQGPGVYVKA